MALGKSSIANYLGGARRALFHLNFYRVHLLYFILTIIVSSGIFYGSSTSSFRIGYTDALFLCTSAMCNVGLNSVNMSSLTGVQQSILFVLMVMGDLTIVTISTVVVRRFYFSRKMSSLLEESSAGRRLAEDIEQQRSSDDNVGQRTNGLRKRTTRPGHESPRQAEHGSKPTVSDQRRQINMNDPHITGYGSFPAPWHLNQWKRFAKRFNNTENRVPKHDHHYLSFEPSLDHKVCSKQITRLPTLTNFRAGL